MKDICFTYKGYTSKIRYSEEDKVFYGKIEGIKSLVSFESRNVATFESSFQEAVNDYLDLCKELNITPEKPKNIF